MTHRNSLRAAIRCLVLALIAVLGTDRIAPAQNVLITSPEQNGQVFNNILLPTNVNGTYDPGIFFVHVAFMATDSTLQMPDQTLKEVSQFVSNGSFSFQLQTPSGNLGNN